MRIIRTAGVAAIATCAIALLASPASARERGHNHRHGQAHRVAAQACKQELQENGPAAFAEKYGRRAMRSCIRTTTEDARNAAQDCRAERNEDPDAFLEKYGTNHNGRNAFGKCVSEAVTGDESGEEEPAGDDDEVAGEDQPGDDCAGEEQPADDGAGEQQPAQAEEPGDDCAGDEQPGDDGGDDEPVADDESAARR